MKILTNFNVLESHKGTFAFTPLNNIIMIFSIINISPHTGMFVLKILNVNVL